VVKLQDLRRNPARLAASSLIQTVLPHVQDHVRKTKALVRIVIREAAVLAVHLVQTVIHPHPDLILLQILKMNEESQRKLLKMDLATSLEQKCLSHQNLEGKMLK